jgi:hypothetical protein
MDFYSAMTAWATLAIAIGTTFLVGTGIGAVLFARKQINAERAYRRVENLERELEKFDTGQCAVARESLAKGRLAQSGMLELLDSETAPSGAFGILNFFEHIGHLTREGHLDARDVWHNFGWWILIMGHDLRPLVDEEREESKTVFCDFEWLVKQISSIEKKEEGKQLQVTRQRVLDFYRDEIGKDQKIKSLKDASPRRGVVIGAKRKPPTTT